MDVANVLQKIVDKLNFEECNGLCWKLVLGGRSDYFNAEQDQVRQDDQFGYDDPENCCVRIGALRISNTNVYKKNDNFSIRTGKDWNLQLFAGIPSRLDIQFYNEQDDTKIEESKWVKYIYPVECCLDGIPEVICGVASCCGCDGEVEILNWTAEMKMNYTDRNLDGWLINTTIREWKS